MAERTKPRSPARYGFVAQLFGFPQLSIRAKAYFAAGGATGVLAILAFIFLSVLSHQNATLNDIEQVYFPRATVFSEYFSRLSQSHAGMFDLLVTAEEAMDEETLYTVSKPKLLAVKQLMAEMATAGDTLTLHDEGRAAYDELTRIMVEYVNSVASAIEMATLDVRLARKHMVEANLSYQYVNEVLGGLVASSRRDTGDAVSAAHAAIKLHSVQFSVILAIAVIALALFGWAISRVMVFDLNGITRDMTALADGDTEPGTMPSNRRGEIGEMVEALQVFRHNAIEIARVHKALQDREREMRIAKEQAEREKHDALE